MRNIEKTVKPFNGQLANKKKRVCWSGYTLSSAQIPPWPGCTVTTAAQSEGVSVVLSKAIRMEKPFELQAQLVRMEETSLHVHHPFP